MRVQAVAGRSIAPPAAVQSRGATKGSAVCALNASIMVLRRDGIFPCCTHSIPPVGSLRLCNMSQRGLGSVRVKFSSPSRHLPRRVWRDCDGKT